MAIYDVTRPLAPGMVVFPGDVIPSLTKEDNGRYLITDLHLSSHSGTHIDAPAHYLRNGQTVDRIPLEHLIGPCRVLDLSEGTREIGPDDLAGRIHGVHKILLKTSFSGETHFYPEYPALSAEAVPLITDAGIHCIGIDSPSIESCDGEGMVHTGLLSKGVTIIELLDLSAVPGGDYLMMALPLRLQGIDGSPARVILCDGSEARSIHEYCC
ncbi:MAG: cyclase family protein [Methanoregulaceae archaeon]|nr:cyclase family protein [Methanoregulaceae archaeon]